MQEIKIGIELPCEIDVKVETAKIPEVTIEAELGAEVDIDMSNIQIVTYYDFIFEEI